MGEMVDWFIDWLIRQLGRTKPGAAFATYLHQPEISQTRFVGGIGALVAGVAAVIVGVGLLWGSMIGYHELRVSGWQLPLAYIFMGAGLGSTNFGFILVYPRTAAAKTERRLSKLRRITEDQGLAASLEGEGVGESTQLADQLSLRLDGLLDRVGRVEEVLVDQARADVDRRALIAEMLRFRRSLKSARWRSRPTTRDFAVASAGFTTGLTLGTAIMSLVASKMH